MQFSWTFSYMSTATIDETILGQKYKKQLGLWLVQIQSDNTIRLAISFIKTYSTYFSKIIYEQTNFKMPCPRALTIFAWVYDTWYDRIYFSFWSVFQLFATLRYVQRSPWFLIAINAIFKTYCEQYNNDKTVCVELSRMNGNM